MSSTGDGWTDLVQFLLNQIYHNEMSPNVGNVNVKSVRLVKLLLMSSQLLHVFKIISFAHSVEDRSGSGSSSESGFLKF